MKTKVITVKNLKIGEGIPKICVPMVGRTKEELFLQARTLVERKADLAEWRADFYEGIFHAEELEATFLGLTEILGSLPLIFTIRTTKEGGSLQISTKDYVNINQKAASLGLASFVDVEVQGEEEKKQKLIHVIHTMGGRVIVSSHNFHQTPPRQELLALFEKLEKAQGDILKVAVMPQTPEDVATLLNVTNQMTAERTQKPVITMSMGELGSISRIMGELYGSAVTFAAVKEASAPGQLPLDEMREIMERIHREICKNRST